MARTVRHGDPGLHPGPALRRDPGMSPFPHDPEAAKAALEAAGVSGRTSSSSRPTLGRAWSTRSVSASQGRSRLPLRQREGRAAGGVRRQARMVLRLDAAISGGLRAPGVLREGCDPAPGSGGSEVRRPLRQASAHAEAETEAVVREVERYLPGRGEGPVPVLALHAVRVSNRVAFTPYDTCMSELAETRIKG